MNRLWPQRLCSAAFFLVLANSWHILLLKQQQDSPELLVARLAVAFGLALVCRSLASRSRPDCHTTLHKLWRKVGTPELVLLGFLFLLLALFHVSYIRAAGDGREYFVQVRSLVIDGDLHLLNDSPFGAREPEIFPFGSAILWRAVLRGRPSVARRAQRLGRRVRARRVRQPVSDGGRIGQRVSHRQ